MQLNACRIAVSYWMRYISLEKILAIKFKLHQAHMANLQQTLYRHASDANVS